MSFAAATLRQKRCVNHPQREASARCPECGKFYCRECISEHDDRILCASCLAKIGIKKETGTTWWAWAPRLALVLLAVVTVYFVFLLIGNILVSFPSEFHGKGGW
jgi:late competence protein required for DNA uptake (superfamily II DNA/RNA helicase)